MRKTESFNQLRRQAAAVERAHIARELHDGIVQAAIGVQVQLAALSLQVGDKLPGVAGELGRLGCILREEIVSLRELMRRMKSNDLEPGQLVDALATVVDRFRRQTGIAVRFVADVDHVGLPPHACYEVTRIVQEALVNVRKHSGARTVCVRVVTDNRHCMLSIADDGCGFPFEGSLTDAELAHEGPLVIRERVRLIGGRLTVESDPGQGARLEIAVPFSTHGIH